MSPKSSYCGKDDYLVDAFVGACVFQWFLRVVLEPRSGDSLKGRLDKRRTGEGKREGGRKQARSGMYESLKDIKRGRENVEQRRKVNTVTITKYIPATRQTPQNTNARTRKRTCTQKK